jgi:hypothetical protein
MYDVRVDPEGPPAYWAEVIFARLRLNPRVNLHQKRAGARGVI